MQPYLSSAAGVGLSRPTFAQIKKFTLFGFRHEARAITLNGYSSQHFQWELWKSAWK